MNNRRNDLLQLAACVAGVTIVWCFVLPLLSRQPTIERRLDWLASEQIDASAMYYTELERMEDWMPEGVE